MEQMYIKPDSDRISYIIDKIRKGVIVIPRFQRDFIWSSSQIVEFFDSILKGYPIGTLILWIPESERFKIYDDIEGFTVSSIDNEKREQCYVLDGRQRITTLLSTLCPEGNNSRKYYYDLEKNQVVSWGKINPPTRLSMLSLQDAFEPMNLIGYLERIRGSRLTDSQKEAFSIGAKTINKKLMDYEIGHITVRGGGISDAVDIFSRLNSKTTPISTDFMIQAQVYEPSEDFLFADAITDIKNDIAEYGLAEIQRDTILKCVFNHTSSTFIDGKAKDIIDQHRELPTIMQKVKCDVHRAAEFLYDECNVIDSRLLPYSYQFVMLALFFKNNNEVSSNQKEILKKWFYYTTYAAFFSNTSLGGIREIIKRFQDFCIGNKEYPMDYTEKVEIEPLNDSFNLNSARGCAFVLAQLSHINRNNSNWGDYFDLYTIPKTGKRNAGNVVLCFSKSDKTKLSHLFNNLLISKDDELGVSNDDKHFLSERGLSLPLMHYYWDNDYTVFCIKRALLLSSIESSFITELFNDSSISISFSGTLKPAFS